MSTRERIIYLRPMLTHTLTAAIVASVAARASAQTVFDDGGIHVIQEVVSDSVEVRNASASLPTTVQVTAGGDNVSLEVFDTSQLQLSGGTISFANLRNSATALINSGKVAHLWAYDSAQVTINDTEEVGHLETHNLATATVLRGTLSHIRAYDGSHVVVGGGAGIPIVSHVGTWDSPSQQSSHVDLLSGQFQGVYAQDAGITNMYGGLAQYARADGGTVNIYGGQVGDVMASPSNSPSNLNVFGGQVGEVLALEGGTTSIWGGQIGDIIDYVPPAGELPSAPPGNINVYGLGLQYSGAVGDRLTGVLSDGTPIDCVVRLERNRLHLHVVPEPTAMALMLIGLVAFAVTGLSASSSLSQAWSAWSMRSAAFHSTGSSSGTGHGHNGGIQPAGPPTYRLIRSAGVQPSWMERHAISISAGVGSAVCSGIERASGHRMLEAHGFLPWSVSPAGAGHGFFRPKGNRPYPGWGAGFVPG